jgi:hypothetical protein
VSWKFILFTFLVCLTSPAHAQAKNGCVDAELKLLRQFYPDGLKVLNASSNHDGAWLDCSSGQPTVNSILSDIHETTHSLAVHGNYLSLKLVSGLNAKATIRPELVDPSHAIFKMYEKLTDEEREERYSLYIRPPFANQDFTFLLDELNAYTHSSRFTNFYPGYVDTLIDPYDGLLAMVSFTLQYYMIFRVSDPKYYSDILMNSDFKNLVSVLLLQAEEVFCNSNQKIYNQLWSHLLTSGDFSLQWLAITGNNPRSNCVF